MANNPSPAAGGGAITKGMRLTDFTSIEMDVEDLASGGMGLVVWGSNALHGGEMIALKLLKPDRLAAAPTREARAKIERQFEEEALIWCHLWPHQSIIAATGLTRFSALGGLPVLLLEYAPNGSLRDQLRVAYEQRQPLSLRATLAWALHIVSALAHMRQRDPEHGRPDPLVHCDLKPENVLLDAEYWALLTDLGLTRTYAALATETMPPVAVDPANVGVDRRALVAQLRAQLQGQGLLPGVEGAAASPDTATIFATRTLAIPPTVAVSPSAAGGATPVAEDQIGVGVAGSPPYMAPEQWRGLNQTVPATDIYAFGTVLYELFAGYEASAPFPRDPRPYLTPQRSLYALSIGADPLTLAWHAAHTDPAYRAGGRGVGAHRLSDPDVREAALHSGPCAELLADGSAAGRQRAEACLAGVDALVERCLAYTPNVRPAAVDVVEALQALAVGPCGLKPLPVPHAAPINVRNEGAFWGNIGMAYSKLGHQEEALVAKRRALEFLPEDPGKWLNLGSSLSQMGEDEHEAASNAAANGQASVAAQRLAQARRYQEESLDAYRRGQAYLTPQWREISPGLEASLAANEASVLGDLERFEEAIEAYQRVLVLAPNDLETQFNMAVDYARWSRMPGATQEERVERLRSAQRVVSEVLAVAPQMSGGRALADRIAAALADPAHRFQG